MAHYGLSPGWCAISSDAESRLAHYDGAPSGGYNASAISSDAESRLARSYQMVFDGPRNCAISSDAERRLARQSL